MIYDALIIGGGPAGGTAGLLLARAGWSVAIIERKSFPRRKVCGEFISATSLSLFEELAITDTFQEMAGPEIKRVGLFVGKKAFTAHMPPARAIAKWGRALGREHLDTCILQKAALEGAVIVQPWSATKLVRQDKHFICHIQNKTDEERISAKLIIMASGSWERNIIHPNKLTHKAADLLGFKNYFKETHLDHDLMPALVFPGGYGGLVNADHDRLSFSCCIRRDTLQRIRQQYPGLMAGEAVLQHIKNTCSGVADVLSEGYPEMSWLSVGPLQPGIRQRFADGIFYIGNTAGEAHPIIAEGISMAMQSGWLLANILCTTADLNKAGTEYSERWLKQFATRLHAAAFFANMAMRPTAAKLIQLFFQWYPQLLSWGARLSGKTNIPKNSYVMNNLLP